MTTAAARQPQRGVTLVELLITMSIVVILITVGVSGMRMLVKRNARATEVNTIVGHLNFTRAQAIMRAANVRVCPLDPDDPSAGCDAAPTDGSWSDGYAVVELDAVGATVAVLRVQQGARAVDIIGNRECFEFEDNGTLRFGGCSGPGSIRFCDPDPDGIDAARVVISSMGRIRLEEAGVTCPDS